MTAELSIKYEKITSSLPGIFLYSASYDVLVYYHIVNILFIS